MSDKPFAGYWEASSTIKNRALVIEPKRSDLSIFLDEGQMLGSQLVNFIEREVQCHIPLHDIDTLIMPHDIYFPLPSEQNEYEINYETVYRQLRDVFQRLKTVEMPGKSQCEYDLFEGLVNLEKVVLGNWRSSGSFKNCTALSSVQMPNVRHIETRAFQGCKSLEFIHFPNAHQIQTYAFLDCSKLKVVAASQVTHLEEGTFKGCQALAVVDMPNVIDIAKTAFPENGAGQLNPIKLLIVSEALSSKDHDYWISRRIDPAVTRITTKQAIVDWGKRRGISEKDNRSLIALYRLHHEAQYRPSWSALGPFCPDMPFWQLLKHLPKDKRDHTLPKLDDAVQKDIDSMTKDELWHVYMRLSGMPLKQIGVCGYRETLTLSHIAKLLMRNVKSAVGSESLIVRENRLVDALSPAQQALEALAIAAVSLLSWTRSGPSL